MASPQISFRLSPYQLARGLKIIRFSEPHYIPASLSQLVKTLYIDYLAKTSLNKEDAITEQDIAEIQNLISMKTSPMSLSDFQQATQYTNKTSELKQVMKEQVIDEQSTSLETTASEISSVSDFSPPAEWEKSLNKAPSGDSND